jgi:hypothetical protein
MAAGLLGRLDDRLNPIVVKELRQAVQSKFVTAVLLLFLLLQLLFLGIALAASGAGDPGSMDLEAGRGVFQVLQGTLLGTCMLFLPAYTGLRLGAERSDVNVDLLFVTTLRPRAIIWGKLLSALVLAVLIFSACAPFMTFTYLLRGIDVPSILVVLGLDFLVVTASIQLAVFLAVIPGNRVLKALVGLGALSTMVYIFVMTLGISILFLEFGFGTSLDSGEFLAAAVGVTASILAATGLLFAWSVALVSPASANRAVGPRVAMLLVWLTTGVVFGVWASATESAWPVVGWTVGMGLLFSLGVVIAVNEREQWGPRVARTIPRSGLLRVPAFLLYSGAAGGILFALLMLGLTELAAWWWGDANPLARGEDYLGGTIEMMAVVALYTFAFTLTAVLVRRLLGRQIRPEFTWVVMLLLLALGCTVPFVFSFLVFYRHWNYETHYYWLLTNPFAAVVEVATSHSRYRDSSHAWTFFTFALTWAALAAALNVPWFIRQVERFQPPRRQAGEEGVAIEVIEEAKPV